MTQTTKIVATNTYKQGWQAYLDGRDFGANPYYGSEVSKKRWSAGYLDSKNCGGQAPSTPAAALNIRIASIMPVAKRDPVTLRTHAKYAPDVQSAFAFPKVIGCRVRGDCVSYDAFLSRTQFHSK